MNKKRNKILSILALLISAYFANDYVNEGNNNTPGTETNKQQKANNNQLESLIRKRQSNIIITIDAIVINVLSDDNQGDRHQRLILKVGRNTLLLAHNIDLAPRVPVRKGDTIQVRGEYEWNEKGGVIHWTHKTNNKKHANGWIIFNNKKYH